MDEDKSYKWEPGTPRNRQERRHGGPGLGHLLTDLEMRTQERKSRIRERMAANPRLVRFRFLHHNL